MKELIRRMVVLHVISLVFVLIGGATASLSQTNECKVSGVVEARFGGVESNATVIFKNENASKSAVSDKDGAYSLLLPSGTYEIRVKRAWELRYKRARIVLSCPTALSLNIYTLPECVSYGCRRPGFNFASFLFSWNKRQKLDLVIAYNTRKKSGTKIEYRDPILTYDKYTVRADAIVQDLKSNTFIAAGKGWIEDGKNRRSFNKLAVKFTKDGIELDGLQAETGSR